MTNLYKIFPELKGKKLYLTGESYAGMYIPFTASYIHKQKDNLNLQGSYIIDGESLAPVTVSRFVSPSSATPLQDSLPTRS